MKLEDLKKEFPSDDVEWRVQQGGIKNGKPWATIIPYITARGVMDRLDSVCGPGNWKTDFEHIVLDSKIEGVMCKLSIKIGGEWVTKQDGSDETDIESFKGGISKALVRSAVQWGVGRYLYNLPKTFAKFVEGRTKFSAKIDGKWYNFLAPDIKVATKPESELPPTPEPEAPVVEAQKPKAKPKKKSPKVAAFEAKKVEVQTKNKDLKEYVIPMGRHLGKRLGDMATEDLKSLLKNVKASGRKNQQINDMVGAIQGYLS